MPTVKQYQRQAQPQPLEGGRITAQPSPESFGAGVGARIERVGRMLYEDEILKQDSIAVMSAERQLAEWEQRALYDPQRGALTSIRGKDTLGIPEVIEKNFNDHAQTIREHLGTERQRVAFDRAASTRLFDIKQSVNRHVATEMRRFDETETVSFIKNARNGALANYRDPARVGIEIERQENAVTDYAARNGFGGDYVKEKRAEVRSATHVGVIERMVANGDDRLAGEYLKAHRTEINGDQISTVEKWVEDGSIRGEGQRQADRILGVAKDRADALNLARQIEDPKVRDAVEDRVQRYWSIREQARSEEQEQIMTHIAGGLDRGGKIAQILPSMWEKLDAGQRSALHAYERMIETGKRPTTDMGTYYDLISLASSPATQDAFARTNLMLYRAKLDDEDFKQLAGIQASLRKGDTKDADKLLSDARTQNQVVDDALLSIGLDPSPNEKTSKGDLDKILKFRRVVRDAVAAVQARTQKPITNDELQKLVDDLVIKGVTEEGILWDTKKHAFELEPGETFKIDIKSVPQKERDKIEDSLRRAGRQVTDEAVTTLYSMRLNRLRNVPPTGQPLLSPPQPSRPAPTAPEAPGHTRVPTAPEPPKPSSTKAPEKPAKSPAHDFRRPTPQTAQSFSGRGEQPALRDSDIDRAVRKAPVSEAEKKRIIAQVKRLTPQARDGKRTDQQRTATMREIINLLRKLDIPDAEIEKAIRRPLRSLE